MIEIVIKTTANVAKIAKKIMKFVKNVVINVNIVIEIIQNAFEMAKKNHESRWTYEKFEKLQ